MQPYAVKVTLTTLAQRAHHHAPQENKANRENINLTCVLQTLTTQPNRQTQSKWHVRLNEEMKTQQTLVLCFKSSYSSVMIMSQQLCVFHGKKKEIVNCTEWPVLPHSGGWGVEGADPAQALKLGWAPPAGGASAMQSGSILCTSLKHAGSQ